MLSASSGFPKRSVVYPIAAALPTIEDVAVAVSSVRSFANLKWQSKLSVGIWANVVAPKMRIKSEVVVLFMWFQIYFPKRCFAFGRNTSTNLWTVVLSLWMVNSSRNQNNNEWKMGKRCLLHHLLDRLFAFAGDRDLNIAFEHKKATFGFGIVGDVTWVDQKRTVRTNKSWAVGQSCFKIL